MKNIFLEIFKVFMNFIYLIFKLQPVKNKVVMLTRQSNKPFVDFKLLEEEFIKQNIEVVMLCKKIEKGFLNKVKYFFHLIESLYHLASSKYCIVDGYSICVSMLNHKKELQIMQIWHALGAIKKFGYQILDYEEGHSKETATNLQMHKNYTYVTCCSEETKKFYQEAFNIKENQVKVLGMPRVDYLKNLEKNFNKEIYKDYPKLKKKKNIVYVPTFRKKQRVEFEELVHLIDKEKYNLIIRLHPLDKNIIESEFEIDKKYFTYDILAIADYVITDYSAVAIEASILNIPVFFYLYDYEKYKNKRGLNINLDDEVPSFIGFNAQEIIDKIENENYEIEELVEFQKKYVETIDMDNTKNIVDLLVGGRVDEYIKKENHRLV